MTFLLKALLQVSPAHRASLIQDGPAAPLQPSGHHPDGSSIQNHSAGSTYPFIVQLREDEAAGIGYAEVVDSMREVRFTATSILGNKASRMSAYRMALDEAERLAQLKRMVLK